MLDDDLYNRSALYKSVMDSIISTFHINLWSLVAQLVNFGVVFVVLYLFALKPLMKAMNERSEKIASGLKDSDEAKKILEGAKNSQDEIIKNARIESEEIIKKAEIIADRERLSIIEKTKEEIARMSQSNMEGVIREREMMRSELRGELASLVAISTEKILKEFSNQKITEGMISKVIKNHDEN